METRTKLGTKNIITIALFIALSFVGSNIKIFGSIAFDSLSGFLAALILDPIYGAAIGFFGHFFTALTSGFLLSIPLHMVIATTMAMTMFVFGLTFKYLKNSISIMKSLVITGIVGIVLNGPVSLAFSMGTMALISGKEIALSLLALFPVLVLGSATNVVISIILFKSLEDIWSKIK